MPNHCHLAVWPYANGDLGRWLHWLLTAPVRRDPRHDHSSGQVWQGRFPAFPSEQDEHLLTVRRYRERPPLRAGLVERAEAWPWSSLHGWCPGHRVPYLHPGPVLRPPNGVAFVNEALTAGELERGRQSVPRGVPLGSVTWVQETAVRRGLESTLRPRGRPRKQARKT